MASTVFVWDMAGVGPKGNRGVGHTSIQVGKTYISWWPAKHELMAGLSSRAKRHSMHEDKAEDGVSQFASGPIILNESKVLAWWGAVSDDQALVTHDERSLGYYRFLTNNCSTTVFRALLVGSDRNTQIKIWTSYLEKSASGKSLRTASSAIWNKSLGAGGSWSKVGETILRSGAEFIATLANSRIVITPADVRAVVTDIWR